MANFERLTTLRNFMVELPAEQVRMDKLIVINRDHETLAEARQPGCGTIACIAGWAICLFDRQDMELELRSYATHFTNAYLGEAEQAEDLLGLTIDEGCYMFYAGWHLLAPPRDWNQAWADYNPTAHLPNITKDEVIQYLDKVLATHNVFVRV